MKRTSNFTSYFSYVAKNNIAKAFFTLLFFVLITPFNAKAQSPASNISGPLKAYTNGTNISLISEIAISTSNPSLSYRLSNNSAGASIVSEGPFIYDRNSNSGTQTIVINPGSSKGSFNIRLNVTNANGACEASKSVTVTNNRYALPDSDPNNVHN